MKRTKKLASLCLALVMIVTMAIGAFAANADLTGHTYEAYQIFSGTQTSDSSDVTLANVQWGSGVNDEAMLTALKADTTIGTIFANCSTAADVAEAIGKWTDNSTEARAFAKIADANKTDNGTAIGNGTKLDPGYYLIVDTTTFNGESTNTVKNLSLLYMTKNGTLDNITNKTDVPEVEKKVQDVNDSTAVTTGWQDSADYDIGDDVPFQLTATLPTNYADYTSYKLVFHDTLSSGLTYKDGSVKVYVVNNGAKTEVKNGLFSVTQETSDNTTKLTISSNDINTFKDNTGNKITIDKDSKIVVEYTATLNTSAFIGSVGNSNKVYLEYSNNPNNGGEGETGKTPEDTVVVFTYKVVVNKYSNSISDENKLAGAAFKLEKKAADETWSTVKEFQAGDATSFTFSGLDDGVYKLTETTTPDGYNTIEPIEFTITATHDPESDSPALIALDGGNKFTGNVATGAVSANIENKSGSTLPSTGGMGTTVLYIIGGILVVGAGILLVTKKRMGADK